MSVFFHNPETGTEQAAFQVQVTSNIERAEAVLRSIPGGAETAIDKAMMKARREHKKFAEEAILKRYTITRAALHKVDDGMTRARITPHISKTWSVGHGGIHTILYTGYGIPLIELSGQKLKDRRMDKPILGIYRSTWRIDGNGENARTHDARVYGFRMSYLPENIRVLKDKAGKTLSKSFVASVKAGKSSTHTSIFERENSDSVPRGMYPDRYGRMVRAINGDQKIKEKMGPSIEQMLAKPEIQEELDAKMGQAVDSLLDDKIRAIMDGKIAI